jgi:hypothetical protein
MGVLMEPFNFGTRVDGDLLKTLVSVCQENPWLKISGLDFEPDGLCCERDYPYSLYRYDKREDLKAFFEHGNWSIRSAVQFDDLIFVNQINGGDEWWTLKVFGGRLVDFESITWRLVIERGGFDHLLDKLCAATEQQCLTLTYDA